MSATRRGQAPSWIGTTIVVVAVIVIVLRAAADLRRGVAPEPAPPRDMGGEKSGSEPSSEPFGKPSPR